MWCLIFIWAAIFFILQWKRHYTFESSADLGWVVEALYTTSQGKGFFWSNLLGESSFGIHVTPILFFLVPFFKLFPKVETIFAMHAIIIVMGGMPVYYLAANYLGKKWGLMFLLAYLGHPLVHGMVMFDANPVAYAAPLLLGALWAFHKKNLVWFWIWGVLSLLVREDVAATVAAMGIYGFWKSMKEKDIIMLRNSAFLGVFSIFWLFISVKILAPFFSMPGGLKVLEGHYPHLGGSLEGILVSLVTKPLEVAGLIFRLKAAYYVTISLSGTAFLSLLNIPLLLASLPGYFRLFFIGDEFHLSLHLHYGALMVPFLFMSAITGIKTLKDRQTLLKWLFVGFIIIVVMTFIFTSGPFLRHLRKAIGPHEQTIQKIISQIPRNSSVAVDGHLYPHLAMHQKCYRFDNPIIKNNPPDYIIADMLHPDLALKAPPIEVLSLGYQIILEENGARLLKRKR